MPRLRQGIIRLIYDGTLHVIADLRGVDFLDSTGLGASVPDAITNDQHWQVAIAGQGVSTSEWRQKNGLARRLPTAVFTISTPA